jgi:hypothetical protein
MLVEWISNGRRLPRPASGRGADTTINELLLAYLRHADGYYVMNGKPPSEPVNVRLALRPLRQLYGDNLARDFGPLALTAVRQTMIDSVLCRSEVNKRVRHVVRAFKGAVSEEIDPPSVHHGLRTVSGLHRGRGRRPGIRAGQAGPGVVRGRHQAPCCPPGVGNGGVAKPFRHAAGRGCHHAYV